MNRHERLPPLGTEALLEYRDGEYRMLRPGQFVRCAITGKPIALDELRYWSVARQEAYSSPEAVLRRLDEGTTPETR